MFVLIIMGFVYGGQPAVEMQEFNSQQTCNDAAVLINKYYGDKSIKMLCVPK